MHNAFKDHFTIKPDSLTGAIAAVEGICDAAVLLNGPTGCTVSGLERITAAGLNLVIHEEYADTLIPFMANQFDLDSLVPPAGAPVGFSATESWIKAVCGRLEVSPAPALALIKTDRKRSHESLNRFNALTGLPKGAGFAVDADASLALPLTTWLYEYLGMVPVWVRVPQETDVSECAGQLNSFLEKIHCKTAWQAHPGQGEPDVVFAGADVIMQLRLNMRPFTGIEISLPGGSYQHVIPKSYMGSQGALYLIERIINGLVTQGC